MSPKSKNIFWQSTRISREDREKSRGHRGAVLWFTGLSGAGKSTLASRLEERLYEEGYSTYILDGDNVRHGLNRDLGFSPEDRTENIRRVGEVARLFADAGVLVATAFISPYREDRDQVRSIMERELDFVEIFVSCPVEVCEERDPKGLYKKARAGEIRNFTGIDAPYEEPESPELVIPTDTLDPDESVDRILAWLEERDYIRLHDEAGGGGPDPAAASTDAAARRGGR